MKPIRVALVSFTLLFTGGCFLGKKPAVIVPVAVPAAQSPAPASTPPAGTPPAGTPAATAPPTVATPPSRTVQVPAAPPADAPKPSPFPPTGGSPKPVVPTPVGPAPALGAILTVDQRRQLDAAYQSDLRQANSVLARLSGRTLTQEQTDSVSRAKAWIRQAGQYHDRDLSTAAELARRARVLTQDLAGALK